MVNSSERLQEPESETHHPLAGRYLSRQLIAPLQEYEDVVQDHQRRHAIAAAKEDLTLPKDDEFPTLVPEDALTN